MSLVRGVSSHLIAESAILNAPFEKDGWRRAVAGISEATGCHGAHLLGMGGPLVNPLNVVSGLDSRISNYLGDPHLHGSVNWRVGSSTVPMAVQHDGHYASYRALHDTSDYDDAASDLDMQYGCQSVIIADETTFLGIAMMRGRREGPCTAETLASFCALLRPLQRAVRVQLALDGEAADLMLGDLGGLSIATVLVDRYGCVCALTRAAELLAGDDGAFGLCGLTFRLPDPADNRRFERGMRALLSGGEVAEGHVITINIGRSEAAPNGRWSASLVRLPRREHGLGFDPHLAIVFRPHSEQRANGIVAPN